MDLLNTFGPRQKALLNALLNQQAGMSVEELAEELKISRNATNQHLSTLAKLELVDSELRPSTGGRPVRGYFLSINGLELFPRRYANLSKALIKWIRSSSGEPALLNCLSSLGKQIALEFNHRVAPLISLPVKISEVASIMNELGYEASARATDDGASEIIAKNCVYHQVAGTSKNFCQLDLSMMEALLNAQVDHQECLFQGGSCCRFGITPR